MKSFLISEYDPTFFVQGFNLQSEDGSVYFGKAGRSEIHIVPSIDYVKVDGEDIRILYLGTAQVDAQFRPGDILMVGHDELVDHAFKALDELEKRGIVVSLDSDSDSKYITIEKEDLKEKIEGWRNNRIPFLCLLTDGIPEGEAKNTLITLIRRVVSASFDNQTPLVNRQED